MIDEAAANNGGNVLAREVLAVMEDKGRRVAAINGIMDGDFNSAENDAKKLWRYLHGKIYSKIFSKLGENIKKFRLSNGGQIADTLSESDEAICLLIVEVKSEQMIGMVRQITDVDKQLLDLQAKATEFAGRNEPVPDHIMQEMGEKKKLKDQMFKKGRKSRKRKKRTSGSGDQDGVGAEENDEVEEESRGGREESLDLTAYEKRYGQILIRLANGRKDNEKMKQWYDAAYDAVKQLQFYNPTEANGSNASQASAESSIQEPGGPMKDTFKSHVYLRNFCWDPKSKVSTGVEIKATQRAVV